MWYRQRGGGANPLHVMEQNSYIWTEERVGSPLKFVSFEVFNELTQGKYDRVALVFKTEGAFQSDGSYHFNYEYSDRFPVLFTRDMVFKVNMIIALFPLAARNTFQETFDSTQGRELLLQLVKQAFGNEDGGSKVPVNKPPPVDSGGLKLVQAACDSILSEEEEAE